MRQQRLDQLRRVRLDPLAAVAVGARHRQQHLVGDHAQQAADPLDDLGVVVAAAAQRDSAALGEVRPEQLAALAEHVVHQTHAERAHLLRRLLLRVGAQPLHHHRHEEGQHAAHLGRRRASLPPPEERDRRLAAPFRRVGEAEEERLQQRAQLLVAQLQLRQPRQGALPHAHVGVGERVGLSRQRPAGGGRRWHRGRAGWLVVVVVAVPVGRSEPKELRVDRAAHLRLAGRQQTVEPAGGCCRHH